MYTGQASADGGLTCSQMLISSDDCRNFVIDGCNVACQVCYRKTWSKNSGSNYVNVRLVYGIVMSSGGHRPRRLRISLESE